VDGATTAHTWATEGPTESAGNLDSSGINEARTDLGSD